MFKKTILIISFLVGLLICIPVYGETSVYVNDSKLVFDVAPVVENGRTLVPLRAIFEALGAEVNYEAATKTVIATKGDISIKLVIGGKAYKNNQEVNLDVPAKNISGRTLVPIRFISEALGSLVSYDANTQTVYIKTESAVELGLTQIFSTASPAIFKLETYDEYGNSLSQGTGFIIENTGKAVTNYHVIEDAYSAIATLTDGSKINVTEILYSNIDRDIAIIKLYNGTYPIVKLGNSDQVVTGQKIVAIGNPYGLENTISDGIISSKSRILDGYSFIQITAPISSGSSGGALLNYLGEVIGVTSSYFVDGQNLNFAVPINDVIAQLNTQDSSYKCLNTYQKVVKDVLYNSNVLSFMYPSNWYKVENTNVNANFKLVFINADNLESSILIASLPIGQYSSLDEYYTFFMEYLSTSELPYDNVELYKGNPRIVNGNSIRIGLIVGEKNGSEIREHFIMTKHGSLIYIITLTTYTADYENDLKVLDKILNTLSFK